MLEILGMLVLAAVLITAAKLLLKPWAFAVFAALLLLLLILPLVRSLTQ